MNPKHESYRVVIAGGGTAGWMAAAALSKKLGPILDITLIESDSIGTVGVGEATIPPIRTFNKILGIDEQEFMRKTQATFKLGIMFENWGKKQDRYLHAFGRLGTNAWLAAFHNFWLRGKEKGLSYDLGDYCIERQAANAGKFSLTTNPVLNYAYHLDATQYARFLRDFSEEHGVKRLEGKIIDVKQSPHTGFIESLTLDQGHTVSGDLFIDCTGFRGLLIEQTLQTGYEDWSDWLPCDRAVAVQTQSAGPALPYTRSIAHESGWQWQIPLQSRVGNGLVYASRYLSDYQAKDTLLKSLTGDPITEPRTIRFQTGRRKRDWNKNCVALGLASGFLEPLESTSIHLIMEGITRLMHLFPFDGVSDALINHYNHLSKNSMEAIRDFIVLHYCATSRDDSEFWRHCRSMEVPESLATRIQLFEEEAYIHTGSDELFTQDSWTQVLIGQGIIPKRYHPLTRLMNDAELEKLLFGIKNTIDNAVTKLPRHQDFIDKYCKAD